MDSNTIAVGPELLRKHDKAGPRYTSYPTAPQWTQDFGQADYRAALQRAAASPDEGLALYIHIPFCRERCLYCGCNVVISKKEEVVDPFLEHIGIELASVAEHLGARRRLVQLHWGGGTPTYLKVEEIRRLFAMITEHFEIDESAEVALEIDPRVTSHEQILALRELGFNRISMGVQDLDPTVQDAIGRSQTEQETRQLFDWCRKAGFEGINMDMIYGLPAQKEESWAKTLDSILEMGPDRLAVYSYAHLPARLKHQGRIDADLLPATEEKHELFAMARTAFVEGGYATIGMDHFARPEDELTKAMEAGRLHRNFMGYTTIADTEMMGVGPSAISYIGGAYAQNGKRLFMYYRPLDEGRLPTDCGRALTEDDLIRRWAIEHLMCNFALPMGEMKTRFGRRFDEYFAEEQKAVDSLANDGLVERRGDSLVVLPLGIVFIRNVAMVFDTYLRNPIKPTQFSRTV
jgi:oxygen-independent coproporphyrinogen-3 oxidase